MPCVLLPKKWLVNPPQHSRQAILKPKNLLVQPLDDWGTILLRKLGSDRLADLRDRLKPKVLPPARIALLIMAVVSILFAVL